MIICNHCPFVIHVNSELVNIANNYQQKGIGFIAINSNDVENYPQDGPELMTQHAKDNKYPFSYLYDETQEVAKARATAILTGGAQEEQSTIIIAAPSRRRGKRLSDAIEAYCKETISVTSN